MQVVVAQHTNCALAQIPDEAEHFERLRSAVDEIAGEPQAISRGIESNFNQQPPQCSIATLDIADRVNGHQENSVVPTRAAISMVAWTSAPLVPGSAAE